MCLLSIKYSVLSHTNQGGWSHAMKVLFSIGCFGACDALRGFLWTQLDERPGVPMEVPPWGIVPLPRTVPARSQSLNWRL